MSAVVVSEKVVNPKVRYFVADRVVNAMRRMSPTLREYPWQKFSRMVAAITDPNHCENITAYVIEFGPSRVIIELLKVDGVNVLKHCDYDKNIYTLHTPASGATWEQETILSLEYSDNALSEDLVSKDIDLYPESEVR